MSDSNRENIWDLFGVKPPRLNVDWNAQINTLRQGFAHAAKAIETGVPDMAHTEDLVIDGAGAKIEARAYTPLAAGVPPGPGLVYLHGGGFVLGDIESFDSICRRIADASRCRVLSVNYRLAPEHKFPTAHDDAVAAYGWAAHNAEKWGVDPTRLAVGGDSAGGNLAIHIAQSFKNDPQFGVKFLLLIYPLAQFADIRQKGLKFQEGSFFSPTFFELFRDAYLPEGQDPMEPRISPLFAEDVTGLPTTHVLTAGWDPLRDEGRAFAGRLASHGIRVTERDYPNQMHGFFNTTAVSASAREAISEAGRVVGRALGAI